MLAPYRFVLAVPGAVAFTVAGVVARLPISTISLGIVLLIAGRTGSYGLAGSVSAACVLAEAVAGPMLGRLVDRVGQARVLVPCVVVFAVSVSLIILTIEQGASRWTTYVAAVAAGASYPPVGAMVRARWTHVLDAGPRLQTAFALESVNDEVVFIAGPVLVTVLATQVHESAGLVAVVLLAGSAGLWLAAQRATEPPLRPESHGDRQPLPVWWLGSLMLVAACLGALFGATEVVTVAFAEEHGSPGLTGVLLATWAFGSMLAGIITGAVTWSAPPLRRYRFGTLALAVVMIPLPFIDSMAVMFVALFLAGFAISPTLVATFSLIEASVPGSRLTEGITWVTTGIALGIAPAAAIAGRLIDDHGASTGYYVAVAGGAVAVLVAWTTSPGSLVRPPQQPHLPQ